jgi:thiosulfate dehydrogenase [quinone] large subunit
MNHRETAYALLRITFGVVFLFNGIGKLMGGVGNFVGGMNQRFAGKLPAFLVMPFSYTLPFAELILGALIVFGLITRLSLVLSGLLLAALTFGTVMLADFGTVAHNTQYALVNFVLLWLVELNRYSLDELFGPRTTAVPRVKSV